MPLSPHTASLFSPKNLSHAFSFQLQMKRLGFRWFPSPPLLSIIPIQIGEKERVGERDGATNVGERDGATNGERENMMDPVGDSDDRSTAV
ncbi:hypothetical protein HanIR_Chr03g0143841 [Helianthus annuus]|nr:hypothetical protein HanIR_Chr03g0143791 [Helianthus annuus]KAJ0602813.1 hypothetical protein HanIR_Chr03g0143841 [Helianthus annuus]